MRILSGGQTGVDEAALKVAVFLKIPIGGWCPEGRGNEKGVISKEFELKETPLRNSEQRTEWNVRDSDATLILSRRSDLHGGTELTEKFARAWNRPCYVVTGQELDPVGRIREILKNTLIRTLNIAGPRESEDPGIGIWTYEILLKAFSKETGQFSEEES